MRSKARLPPKTELQNNALTEGLMISKSTRPPCIQQIRDCSHRVPVSRRRRNTKYPIQRTKVADHLHVTAVLAQNEPAVDGVDFQQPSTGGRHGDRHRRLGTRPPRQDAHETRDARLRIPVEHAMRQQPGDVTSVADHDFRHERKPAFELTTQLCLTDAGGNDERASGADINRTEMLELFREQRRSERAMPADVDAAKKDDVCHRDRRG